LKSFCQTSTLGDVADGIVAWAGLTPPPANANVTAAKADIKATCLDGLE